MLVLICDGLLDLLVLSKHERVVQIAMRMQLCQNLVSFLGLAVINEPSVSSSVSVVSVVNGASTYLGDSGKSKIKAARMTAGKICNPRGTLH